MGQPPWLIQISTGKNLKVPKPQRGPQWAEPCQDRPDYMMLRKLFADLRAGMPQSWVEPTIGFRVAKKIIVPMVTTNVFCDSSLVISDYGFS